MPKLHEPHMFCGVDLVETEEGTTMSMDTFIRERIREFSCKGKSTDLLSDEQRSGMRACVGCIRWLSRVSLRIGYELSQASQYVGNKGATICDANRLNKLVRWIHSDPPRLFLPRLPADVPIKLVIVCDAGDPPDGPIFKGRWNAAFCVGYCPDVSEERDYSSIEKVQNERGFVPIYWKAGTTRRVASSSYDGESLTCMEALDVGLAVQALEDEVSHDICPTLFQRVTHDMHHTTTKTPMELDTDAKDFVTATRSLVPPPGFTKRRKSDVYDVQELRRLKFLRKVRHIRGVTNPLDAGTKRMSTHSQTMKRLINMEKYGKYSADVG